MKELEEAIREIDKHGIKGTRISSLRLLAEFARKALNVRGVPKEKDKYIEAKIQNSEEICYEVGWNECREAFLPIIARLEAEKEELKEKITNRLEYELMRDKVILNLQQEIDRLKEELEHIQIAKTISDRKDEKRTEVTEEELENL